MKYMTPDLLARVQSPDEDVAEAAMAEWESACQAHNKHLEEIREGLPANVRRFLERLPCLHDARVVMAGTLPDRRLSTILCRPEDAPDVMVRLDYSMAGPATKISHPSLADAEGPMPWLYDEFGLGKRDGIVAFTHSIRFSGGGEVKLSFCEFNWGLYEKAMSLLPLAVGSQEPTAAAG